MPSPTGDGVPLGTPEVGGASDAVPSSTHTGSQYCGATGCPLGPYSIPKNEVGAAAAREPPGRDGEDDRRLLTGPQSDDWAVGPAVQKRAALGASIECVRRNHRAKRNQLWRVIAVPRVQDRDGDPNLLAHHDADKLDAAAELAIGAGESTGTSAVTAAALAGEFSNEPTGAGLNEPRAAELPTALSRDACTASAIAPTRTTTLTAPAAMAMSWRRRARATSDCTRSRAIATLPSGHPDKRSARVFGCQARETRRWTARTTASRWPAVCSAAETPGIGGTRSA